MHHTCVQPALSTKNESFKGKYIRTIGKQNHRAEKKRVSTALPELTLQEVTHPPFYWSLSGWSSQLGSILRYPTCLSLTADGTWKKKRPTGNIVFQCKHSKRKKKYKKRKWHFQGTLTNCDVPSQRVCTIMSFEGFGQNQTCLSLCCYVLCAQWQSFAIFADGLKMY